MAPATINEWLFNKFVEWEKQQPGRRSTYSAFARYLDVKQQSLSSWINGTSEPKIESAYKISLKLGNEIFEIMNIEPPDNLLLYITANWDQLPPEIQNSVHEQIAHYLATHGENNEPTTHPVQT